jgi:hypothetical protein
MAAWDDPPDTTRVRAFALVFTGAAEDTPAATSMKTSPMQANRRVPNIERLRRPVIYTKPLGRKIRKPEPEREPKNPAGATGFSDFEFPKAFSSRGFQPF